MPKPTPTIKVMQTEGHGATIVLHGELFDEAYAHALKLAEEQKLTFVHPFDDPHIIAGQGTVALEMLYDAPQIDTLVVPIGGGRSEERRVGKVCVCTFRFRCSPFL